MGSPSRTDDRGAGAATVAHPSADANAAGEDRRAVLQPAAAACAATNVAIVDDEESACMLLEGYVRLVKNTEVSVFTDPVQGLAWCLENRPDLVLLDYMMPVMAGVEFLRRMRAGSPLEHTPVIMVTARDRGELLAEVLELGMTDFLRKPFSRTEFLARVRNMLELGRRHRELELANHQLYVQAITDPLTGLKNRRFFLGTLEHEIEQSQRYSRPCSLAFIDLDHFKAVNDTYGHDAGDHVLRELSRFLMSELRSADQIGRLGGEEFAILFPETGLAQAMLACRHLQAALRRTVFPFSGFELRCVASIGLTEVDPHGDNLAAVMKRADKALYRAKTNGRDRIETSNGR
jgi:diguanylate cyclase (GGDEF)-like protein